MAIHRIRRVSRLFAQLSGWLIVPMMLTIFLDAVLRGVFNTAVAGVVELNSLLLVAMVYLGLAGAQADAANFRVTLLTERVGHKVRNLLIGFGYLVLLVSLVLLLWFCLNAAIFSYQRDEVSYGLIEFPLWPSRILICVGLVLLLVQYLADGVVFLLTGADPFMGAGATLDKNDSNLPGLPR